MSDWDEIKRLAADFQRTQTSDTLQRISERNCIDIVKKLTDLNLIELIYTCDGKEFLTPAHLLKEIEDQIYINGGRMHLHDLATNLNVDYQHVENRAKDLARDKPDEYSLILGQIIHSTYKNTLGKQIYECMIVNGQLSIADFAKSLDLPAEFLLTIVKELLPKVMDDFVVSQDERTYYTTDMMDRYKSTIAGTLSAISKPTTIASLMKRLEIPERIFAPTIDILIKEGRIDATVENRLFIPAIYAREQSEWIDKFYTSNSYIEYDVLSRMDIKQPKAFLKKRYPDGVQLKTCFISQNLLFQVESLIEDCIASNGWIDISTIVPSAIEAQDIEQILQDIFKTKKFTSSCLVFNQTNVCSLGFIATCKNSFSNLMQARSQEHLKQGKLVRHFIGGRLKEPVRKEFKETTKEVTKNEDPLEWPNEKASQLPVEAGDISTKEEETSKQEDKLGDEVQAPSGLKGNKKDRRDKKGKMETGDFDDSDEEHVSGKKSKSRKSGGGTQGREIKQKSVKKKYIPGNKGNQRSNYASDEEYVPKAPRSNKGRAARRGMSPERPTSASIKSKGAQSSSVSSEKEPLIFMNTEEIVDMLMKESRGSGECLDGFFESIANTIESDLNASYETIAKKTLDEYLKTQANEENVDSNNEDDIELIE